MTPNPITIEGDVVRSLVNRQALADPVQFEDHARDLFDEYPDLHDLSERIIFSQPEAFSIVCIQPWALTTLLLDDDNVMAEYLGQELELMIPAETLKYRMEAGWLCAVGVGTDVTLKATTFIHFSKLTSQAYLEPNVSLKEMSYLSVQH